jgi:hypothetical protein
MLKAAGAMRTHLLSVERNLLKQQHFEDPEAAAEDSSGAGIPRDHPDPPWPDSEANHGREIVR